MAREDIFRMTQKELKRISIINDVLKKLITQKDAACVLDLSYRQIRRIVKRVRKEGAVVMGFDDYLRSILRVRRSKTVARIREKAKAGGMDMLPLKDINYWDYGLPQRYLARTN